MHISQKLAEAEKTGKPMFSFEFFPPKTAQVGTLGVFVWKYVLTLRPGSTKPL